MTTNYKWRVMLFVRAVDNTPANRQAFGDIFANNTSGETAENEGKLFDAAIRLSTSGTAPAQAFGIEVAVKSAMRDALRAFLDTLPQCRYYVTMNTATEANFDGKLVLDNKGDAGQPTLVNVPPWDIEPFTMYGGALPDLFTERGLQVIPDE